MLVEHVDSDSDYDSDCDSCIEDKHDVLNKIIQYK